MRPARTRRLGFESFLFCLDYMGLAKEYEDETDFGECQGEDGGEKDETKEGEKNKTKEKKVRMKMEKNNEKKKN